MGGNLGHWWSEVDTGSEIGVRALCTWNSTLNDCVNQGVLIFLKVFIVKISNLKILHKA